MDNSIQAYANEKRPMQVHERKPFYLCMFDFTGFKKSQSTNFGAMLAY